MSKRARKNVYHLTLLSPFLRMVQTEGMLQREGPQWGHELVGCMLLQSVPWQLFHRTFMGLISVLHGLQVRKFQFHMSTC